MKLFKVSMNLAGRDDLHPAWFAVMAPDEATALQILRAEYEDTTKALTLVAHELATPYCKLH